MKLLLVCGAGMSSSLLMNKMQEYLKEIGEEDSEVNAVSMLRYQMVYKDYDVMLLGPQIAYTLKGTMKNIEIPYDVMNRLDYGRANCTNIWKQAKKLYEKAGK
jgi:PTS system cellobiose-specific IIB component